MELITILNRCHRFRGFVYQHAHFSADKKSIEVAVRPRKGSAAVCSRCHLPAPGYDQLAERRFEFIPLWGFLVFLLYTMRRVDCRRCGVVAVEEVPWGDGKRTLTKAYMLFLARWGRLNNKAKVTVRKSYGFRTHRVLELVLYHSLGKLPEPVSTHNSSDESLFRRLRFRLWSRATHPGNDRVLSQIDCEIVHRLGRGCAPDRIRCRQVGSDNLGFAHLHAEESEIILVILFEGEAVPE